MTRRSNNRARKALNAGVAIAASAAALLAFQQPAASLEADAPAAGEGEQLIAEGKFFENLWKCEKTAKDMKLRDWPGCEVGPHPSRKLKSKATPSIVSAENTETTSYLVKPVRKHAGSKIPVLAGKGSGVEGSTITKGLSKQKIAAVAGSKIPVLVKGGSKVQRRSSFIQGFTSLFKKTGSLERSQSCVNIAAKGVTDDVPRMAKRRVSFSGFTPTSRRGSIADLTVTVDDVKVPENVVLDITANDITPKFHPTPAPRSQKGRNLSVDSGVSSLSDGEDDEDIFSQTLNSPIPSKADISSQTDTEMEEVHSPLPSAPQWYDVPGAIGPNGEIVGEDGKVYDFSETTLTPFKKNDLPPSYDSLVPKHHLIVEVSLPTPPAPQYPSAGGNVDSQGKVVLRPKSTPSPSPCVPQPSDDVTAVPVSGTSSRRRGVLIVNPSRDSTGAATIISDLKKTKKSKGKKFSWRGFRKGVRRAVSKAFCTVIPCGPHVVPDPRAFPYGPGMIPVY